MELVEINERVFYIPNVTNIGVIKNNDGVILIDTGIDDDAAKKILKCLESCGLRPLAIINTHSHADHIGGNAYIKGKTGAKIYSPSIEAEIIEYPYFEPFYLFSGADPVKDLKNKFLMAKPSSVDYVIGRDDTELIIDGLELTIIGFPGHAINQIGVAADNVLFCADSVFSKEVLKRHKLPFCIDIKAQKETLEVLKQSSFGTYIPSHGEPTENVAAVADAYMEIISGVERLSLDFLGQRRTGVEYLKYICDRFEADIKAIGQYYLMNTISMAYLSFLNNEGKIRHILEGNILFWEKI